MHTLPCFPGAYNLFSFLHCKNVQVEFCFSVFLGVERRKYKVHDSKLDLCYVFFYSCSEEMKNEENIVR